MANGNREQLITLANSFTESDYWERDVDIIIRKMGGERNPLPYITPADFWERAHNIGGSMALGQLATSAFTEGKIEEQEERLQGRNRFASIEQRVYVWLVENGICRYCKVEVVPHELSVPKRESMHADHDVPAYYGGKTLVENMACSCATCNTNKGIAYGDQYSNALSELANEHRVGLVRARSLYRSVYRVTSR